MYVCLPSHTEALINVNNFKKTNKFKTNVLKSINKLKL